MQDNLEGWEWPDIGELRTDFQKEQGAQFC